MGLVNSAAVYACNHANVAYFMDLFTLLQSKGRSFNVMCLEGKPNLNPGTLVSFMLCLSIRHCRPFDHSMELLLTGSINEKQPLTGMSDS